MTQIRQITGRAIPVSGNDIDTDRIIPARFLRCVTFDGLGQHAFADDRKQVAASGGVHPWDDPRFAGAKILAVNSNFGCGSSREHAPQALARWGISALVGVSFSEIFAGNCLAMGLPCLRVAMAESEAIQAHIQANPAQELTLDLTTSTLRGGDRSWPVGMPEAQRQQFIAGTWDATGELLAGRTQIASAASRLPYLTSFA